MTFPQKNVSVPAQWWGLLPARRRQTRVLLFLMEAGGGLSTVTCSGAGALSMPQKEPLSLRCSTILLSPRPLSGVREVSGPLFAASAIRLHEARHSGFSTIPASGVNHLMPEWSLAESACHLGKGFMSVPGWRLLRFNVRRQGGVWSWGTKCSSDLENWPKNGSWTSLLRFPAQSKIIFSEIMDFYFVFWPEILTRY